MEQRVIVSPRSLKDARTKHEGTYRTPWLLSILTAITGFPFFSLRKSTGPKYNDDERSKPLIKKTATFQMPGDVDINSYVLDENRRKRKQILAVVRLAIFTVFAILYATCLLLANDCERIAPVSEQARLRFFPSTQDSLEDVVSQEFTKPMQPFMPGPDAAHVLNSWQNKCRQTAIQLHESQTLDFGCDFIRIEFKNMRKSPYRGIPCNNRGIMEKIIIHGDYEPFDELPTIVKALYKRANISQEDMFPTRYPIAQTFPLFDPLFTTEEDRHQGLLGPLPLLNQKLNALATSFRVDEKFPALFADKTPFAQSSALPRRPPPSSLRTRSVERNHHWDIAMMCEPQELIVSTKVYTIRSPVPLWWRYKVTFRATGRELSYFRAILHVRESLSYSEYHSWHVVLPLSLLLLFFLCYFTPALTALLFLPRNLYRLYKKSSPFKRIIYDCIDPFGSRIRYSSKFKVLIEDIAMLFAILGFCFSLYDVFSSTSLAAYYDETIGRKVAAFHYWKDNMRLNSWELTCHILFGLWTSAGWHCVAVVLFLIRLLEWTFVFGETSVFLITFLFALFPVIHFMIIFFLMLLIFSFILFATYGRSFTQYCSLPRCMWSILLYSFSFGEQSMAENYVVPLIEDTAVGLQFTLLSFQIIVVIIFLNMFTTIVIDAYNVANDRASSPAKMARLQAAMWYRAKKFCGFSHELEEEASILGGNPGAIVFRTTVPSGDNPLSIHKKTLDYFEIVQRMHKALKAFEEIHPDVVEMQRSCRRIHSEDCGSFGDDVSMQAVELSSSSSDNRSERPDV